MQRRSNGKGNVKRALHEDCDRLGLPLLSPHGLRHLHLSLLAMHGVPLKAAQARAGHSSPVVTLKVYQRVLLGGWTGSVPSSGGKATVASLRVISG